jgi:hypothetical protein
LSAIVFALAATLERTSLPSSYYSAFFLDGRLLRAASQFVHRNMDFRAVENQGRCGKVAR